MEFEYIDSGIKLDYNKCNQKLLVMLFVIWSLSINFRSSDRKTQCQQKPVKNITHFTTLNSLNSTAFTKHFESKCLYILVDLRKEVFFQRRKKLVSGGAEGGEGRRLITSLKRLAVLGLVKCFKMFHFN